MIIIEKLAKYYGETLALHIPRLEIGPGICAVLGHNGSGKSTLLSCLAGLLDYSGSITQCGHPLSSDSVAYMPQKPYLFSMSVQKNVELALRRFERAERPAKALGYLRSAGAEALSAKKAHKLSGGEGKRVALARTLATERPLLLLDEPTSEMDSGGVPLVEAAIMQYQRRFASTVLLATHNLAQAARLADAVIVLESGRVAYAGDAHCQDAPSWLAHKEGESAKSPHFAKRSDTQKGP